MWKIFIVIAELFGALASKDGRHSLAVTFRMVIMQKLGPNWKTSLAGIAAILTALATVLQTLAAGHTVDPLQWGLLFTAIMNGIGNIQAKDRDVTGGTVPQTDEAAVRVEAPEVITRASPLGHDLYPTSPQRPTL
jgi:hypothetical protein